MKIYTKTGDAGTTGLIDGSRVGKDDLRVSAYGEVDELNSVLGLARAEEAGPALDALLHEVQRDLFALGAQLADPKERIAERKQKAAIADARVQALEDAIDEHEAELPALKAFILPGGSRLGAHLHLARTVCRRAERGVVRLSRQARVDPQLVVYLNRLADLLFVLARHANHRLDRPEHKW